MVYVGVLDSVLAILLTKTEHSDSFKVWRVRGLKIAL